MKRIIDPSNKPTQKRPKTPHDLTKPTRPVTPAPKAPKLKPQKATLPVLTPLETPLGSISKPIETILWSSNNQQTRKPQYSIVFPEPNSPMDFNFFL